METNISLPMFLGLYESNYINEIDSYYEIMLLDTKSKTEIKKEYDLINWEKTFENISKKFYNYFINIFKKPNFIKKIEYSGLWSPQYYNYSTDQIIVKIELNEKWEEKTIKQINKWAKNKKIKDLIKEYEINSQLIQFNKELYLYKYWELFLLIKYFDCDKEIYHDYCIEIEYKISENINELIEYNN